MSAALEADLLALLRTTTETYGDKVPAELAALERRLAEPLRLAIAGIVKAGKSTLLNALLGERVAATDTGESTRLVTWYRYAATASVTLFPKAGPPTQLPISRNDGQLSFDLDRPLAEIDRIEVGWPAPALRSMVLIDTPGIASLSPDTSVRATEFVAPEGAPSAVDAVVYLLRRVHPSDVRFLEAFQDTVVGASRTVNAIAVLSRADEVGSGRIDSLLSARRVARRYEQDDELAALTLGVFPVAGLLAEGARTIQEAEFAALGELAALERSEREALLVSADRFVALTDRVALGTAERKDLLARFGIFGIRLAISLIRSGIVDAETLALEMTRQSGLDELKEFIALQFVGRSRSLKALGILDIVERLLEQYPVSEDAAIRHEIERIRLTLHDLDELALLSQARTRGLPSVEDATGAVRIVGGSGTGAHQRLDVTADTDTDELQDRFLEKLATWRSRSHNPANDRSAADAYETVIRSLERTGASLIEDRSEIDSRDPSWLMLDGFSSLNDPGVTLHADQYESQEELDGSADQHG